MEHKNISFDEEMSKKTISFVEPSEDSPEEYRGIYMEDYRTKRVRKKGWRHPIFLYTPDLMYDHKDPKQQQDYMFKLNQVVNVYEHTIDDFEFNSLKIAKHYKKYYGVAGISLFTLGQGISFRVYPEQKEPFQLSLFSFFINYTMLITPIEIGVDLHDWKPWVPQRWSTSGWCNRIDDYIEMARPYANMRKICECLGMTRWLMNMFATMAGDRLGLSISNNEFIEVAKRSKDARESITCTFPIPEDITPPELETLTMDRTNDLLDFIGTQYDLSMSIYVRNKLFNPPQFREYAVHMCHKPDLDGTTIPYTYNTNIIMGVGHPLAFSVDAQGGRKAEITKLNVSDAGTLERALCQLMSPVRFVDINYECDSRHYRRRHISSSEDLVKLDGRVATLTPDIDPVDNEYFMIHPKKHINLIGRTVYVKTPITCTHPRRNEGYICSACYGKLMANLNRDVHIGRLAAVQSADEMEQKLLSAKHALKTNTVPIEFGEEFFEFFELGNGQILLNRDMLEQSNNPESDFYHYHLEFYPHGMKKNQDGESRHLDRSTSEIVIYDDRDDRRINISEKNGAPIYLSPEFNDEHFLRELHYRDEKEIIRIPFSDLADGGVANTQVLFEFSYKNNELADPLLTLEKIMFNGERIDSFSSYDECLDTLIPLFIRGGIYLPDYQAELLVSQLVTDMNRGPVDWNDPHPEYRFDSINRSILRNRSVLTSILSRESAAQIAGAYDAYNKSGTSGYDYFVYEANTNSPWAIY